MNGQILRKPQLPKKKLKKKKSEKKKKKQHTIAVKKLLIHILGFILNLKVN